MLIVAFFIIFKVSLHPVKNKEKTEARILKKIKLKLLNLELKLKIKGVQSYVSGEEFNRFF